MPITEVEVPAEVLSVAAPGRSQRGASVFV